MYPGNLVPILPLLLSHLFLSLIVNQLYFMSEKYKIRNQDKLYFVTFSVVKWVDVFTRIEYKDIIIESLRHCQQ